MKKKIVLRAGSKIAEEMKLNPYTPHSLPYMMIESGKKKKSDGDVLARQSCHDNYHRLSGLNKSLSFHSSGS